MLVQYFKDDVIVFNNKKYEIVDGKGVFNNCILEFIFNYLNVIGILIYFICCMNMCE